MIQLTDNVWAEEVPADAWNFKVSDHEGNFEGVRGPEEFELPPGSWEFLFCTNNVTEEEAAKVIDCIYNYFPDTLLDNIFADVSVSTKLDSFLSLMQSKSLDPELNYAILRKQ